jgi:hypothetical protein
MTCRGYDSRTVKINKSVKRLAATILNQHDRGQFIRDYVRVAQTQARSGKKSKDAE